MRWPRLPLPHAHAVVAAVAFLLAAMWLVPPWWNSLGYRGVRQPLGYAFLFASPDIRVSAS
jgi:hypothetical protein